MGLPDGQCFKCKAPLIIEIGTQRPLCTDCEKEINEKIAKMMKSRGKEIKGKCLVFPKPPKEEDAA